MPRISFRIRPAVGFFHHEKASRMKKKKRKGEREKEKIERIVTASRANRAEKS